MVIFAKIEDPEKGLEARDVEDCMIILLKGNPQEIDATFLGYLH